MEKLYTAVATTKGGRNGHVSSSDNVLDLELRMPKELGGEEGYTTPEQLFSAGYAACFASGLEMIARRKKLNADGVEITVATSLCRHPSGEGFRLHVEITGLFPKGISNQHADELMKATHDFCPYSRAIKGNVEVILHHKLA